MRDRHRSSQGSITCVSLGGSQITWSCPLLSCKLVQPTSPPVSYLGVSWACLPKMAQTTPVSLLLFPRKHSRRPIPPVLVESLLGLQLFKPKLTITRYLPILSHLAYIYWRAFMALSSKANLSPESLLISISVHRNSFLNFLFSSSALGLFIPPSF